MSAVQNSPQKLYLSVPKSHAHNGSVRARAGASQCGARNLPICIDQTTQRMTTSISLILFDMDDVLSHYDRAARIRYLASLSGQSPDAVREAIWGSGLEDRADSGSIGDEEYLQAMGELLGCRISRDDWLASRRASISPNQEVLALVTALASRHRVAVLTNNCRMVSDHIRYLNAAVADIFGTQIYASALFSSAKPSASVYLRCLDRLGVSAAETLFVDDLEPNVTGAIDAGLHGHVFTGAGTLSAELQRLNLL
jgi:glucose-1-phosphatase